MIDSDWNTLPPQPAMPEWTVATGRLSLGERMAARLYRISLEKPTPWWGLVVMPAFCLAWPVLRAWANGEMSIVVLLLLSLALAGFHAWERQGFVDLIGRYDAEVRHLSTWHPPDLDRSRP